MDSTPRTWIDAPATGLSSYVAEERATTAPILSAQGTALSLAGTCVVDAHAAVLSASLPAAHVASLFTRARGTDLPGPVPRGAPV